ncbi:hypothetical protein HELRODRAFT_173660 [Helobdella robusta]|uniref:Calcium signal-modulating cyclophilin ligand n=1 Tax=Helobdella robusta TaxID=6412 RepID=T1F734_HELRO|nr:hypothetical protein HELRODRAFT_173660 [Helobdella robusta]ESO03368.1 hypothetical protein HELRODRAFT_173660 [Helobdella robusta]
MADPVAIRERRMQKILKNSEERLKKLTNTNKNISENFLENGMVANGEKDNGTHETTKKPTCCLPSSDENMNQTDRLRGGDDGEKVNPDSKYSTTQQANTMENVFTNSKLSNCTPEKDIDISAASTSAKESTKTDDNNVDDVDMEKKLKEFLAFRCFFIIIVAVTTRLIIKSSFKEFIVDENIIYHFVMLEVIFFSYQKLQKLVYPRSTSAKNLILSSMLAYVGLDIECLHTYNYIMSSVLSVFNDFVVYLFSFITVHYLLS